MTLVYSSRVWRHTLPLTQASLQMNQDASFLHTRVASLHLCIEGRVLIHTRIYSVILSCSRPQETMLCLHPLSHSAARARALSLTHTCTLCFCTHYAFSTHCASPCTRSLSICIGMCTCVYAIQCYTIHLELYRNTYPNRSLYLYLYLYRYLSICIYIHLCLYLYPWAPRTSCTH